MRKLGLLLIYILLLSTVFWRKSRFSFSQGLLPGLRVRVTETITEIPYQSPSNQVFELAGITVLAPRYPEYHYGDRVMVEGTLKEDSSSQRSRLLRKGEQHFVLVYPEIIVTESVENQNVDGLSLPLRVGQWFTKLRLRIVALFQELLPEPHASLLSGIVLGHKARFPEEFYTFLQNTGTLHVMAASGMNVTIVGGVLVAMLVRFFSRKTAMLIAMVGIALYSLLAGGSASIIRAAIMGSIAYLATFVGHQRDGVRALTIAVLLMLLWDPAYLADIGWQLSVAATFGIILLYPKLKALFKGWGKVSGSIGDELAVTLSAQMATLPLIVYHFGRFSVISPLANVLVAPVIPVLTVWGGAMAIVGLASTDAARLVGWGVWVFLEYFKQVVERLGGSWGAVALPRLPFSIVVGYYLVFGIMLWRLNKGIKATFR